MINRDPLLVVYVDGELDPEAALKLEPLIATDPHVLQRVEMFRETAALLRDACADRFFARNDPFPRPHAGALRAAMAGQSRRLSLQSSSGSVAASCGTVERPPSVPS